MRATIELPDDLRAMVLAVAARRGYRGYSKVIVEALEFYLAEKAAADTGLDRLPAPRPRPVTGRGGSAPVASRHHVDGE